MDSKKFQTFCDCFFEAVYKVAVTIPGLEMSTNGKSVIHEKTYTAIVGVVGFNIGRVHVKMNKSLINEIYQRVNGEMALDERDLCFYLAEFTNMVAGNGITRLNKLYKGINLRLTPPAVFVGDNLEVSTSPKVLASEQFFYTPLGSIQIQVGFEGK